MKNAIKILVFDLGGVLLRLNTPTHTFGLQENAEDFLQQWIHASSVRQFEQGSMDAKAFAAKIVEEINLPYGADEFLARFEAWPDALYDGILDVLDDIPSQYSRALLSNTNAIHWERDGIASTLENRFEKVFLSYVTGHVKPDVDAFLHVQREFACKPHDIAFFDDNPTNVAAAARFGCQAFLTRGIDELRSTLDNLDINQ